MALLPAKGKRSSIVDWRRGAGAVMDPVKALGRGGEEMELRPLSGQSRYQLCPIPSSSFTHHRVWKEPGKSIHWELLRRN